MTTVWAPVYRSEAGIGMPITWLALIGVAGHIHDHRRD